jgi:hypothetical protein
METHSQAPTQVLVDLLVVCHCRVMVASVFRDGSDMRFDIRQTILIESPLLWVTFINSYLLTLSDSNVLVISEISESLKRLSSLDLSTTVGSTPERFCHFMLSRSKAYLGMASKSDHAMIVSLLKPEEPTSRVVFFPGYTCHSLSIVNGKHDFIILATDSQNTKFYLTISGKRAELTKVERGEQQVLGFISIDDRLRVVVPVVCTNSVQVRSKSICPVPGEIAIYSALVGGTIVAQLKDKTIVALYNDPQSELEICDCVEYEKIWLLPNKVLVCSGYDTPNLLICLPKPPQAKKPVPLSQVPCQEEVVTPIIHECIVFRNEVYAASKDRVYKLSQISPIDLGEPVATIPHDDAILFVVDSENIIVSTADGTRLLSGELKIKTGRTLAVLQFVKSTIQVTENALVDLTDGREHPVDVPIVAAAGNGWLLLVADAAPKLTLFTRDLTHRQELSLMSEPVCALSLGDHYIAVGTDRSLYLLDFQLAPLPTELPIPSPCTSLCFRENGLGLLMSTQNGAVIRYRISPGLGLTDDISFVYFGRPGCRLLPMPRDDLSVLILDDRLCVYQCQHVLLTAVTDFSFFTTTIQRDSDPAARLLHVVIDHILYSFDHRQFKFQHGYHPVTAAVRPHLVATDDFLFAVSTFDNRFRIVDVIRGIESDVVCGSVMCSAGFKSQIAIVLATNEIHFFTYDGQFTHTHSVQLENRPTQICYFYKLLLIAFPNSLRVADVTRKGITFRRTVLSLPVPVCRLVSHGFVWGIFEDGHVGTFLYNWNSNQVEFLSLAKFHRPIGIFPIDDLSAVVVDESGLLSIARIRTEVAHGSVQNEGIRGYDIMGEMKSPMRVNCVCRRKDCLIYFTGKGEAKGLIAINCSARFKELLRLQKDVKESYPKVVGFSVAHNTAQYAVDLDLLDAFQHFAQQGSVNDGGKHHSISQLVSRERLHFVF